MIVIEENDKNMSKPNSSKALTDIWQSSGENAWQTMIIAQTINKNNPYKGTKLSLVLLTDPAK